MSKRNLFLLFVVAAVLLVATEIPTKSNTNGQVGLIAGRNVNMVSGTEWPGGDPWLQRQNEPSIAVSTRNPLHLLAGANDYRSIDVYKVDELPGFEKVSSARDAWLGVFKSYDGGQSWTSTLLPGYLHADTTPPEAPTSPLLGFEAAADPVVRAGTNGLFYYSGITFNRGQRGLGQVFVARFIDNNNKETGAIEYIDTKIIDVGNEGHFIDKPSIVVDIPRDGSPMTTLPNGQIVPSGNVYIVYTSFMGDLAEDAHSKMMFSMSTDCGETWSTPSQITDAGQPYQAATLAINPIDGRPYVAYRRFAKDHTDAIMMCWAERKEKETEEGYWHGKIKFSKPIVLTEIDPFDQPTSEVTFRTNDYPTMTIDKDGVIYVAWSQRGLGPYGEGKIVMKTSADDGQTWVGPALVDDPSLSGYEFMPSLTSGAGKVMMLWYDQQYDVCGHFDDQYIQENYPIRHTIDVQAAEIHSIPDPYFSYETIQVSRYPWFFTFDDPNNPIAVQLQHNMPNLRIFGGGTVPFLGDYIDITASPMFIFENGEWKYNTYSNSVYHVAWTDNRDVRPPGPGGEWWDYVAPGEGCGELDQNKTGIRNQNIYTSRITEGIIAGSPGNTKSLNMDRAFVVFVKNTTGTPLDLPRDLILEIVETSGATAYFMKAGENVGVQLEVEVPPQSSVSATVMVESNSNEYATVRINVYEGTDLLTYILLNPDSTNPFIEDPEGLEPGTPHVGSEGETHTPHVGSEDVINWEYSVDSPHVGSEDATSPHVGSNDDWVTPHVGSDDDIVSGSTIHVGTNNHVILSNIVNPHVGSNDFDAIPENSSMTDIIWTVENRGNTTSTFTLSSFPFYDYNPDQIAVQLIVYKVYTTPTALGCELKEQEHHELIVSQTSPHVGSDEFPSMSVPWSFSDVTFSIPPKGTGEQEVEYKVILRYMDKDTTDGIELNPEDQGIIVKPEAPDIIGGVVIPPASALVIKTRTIDLDNGIAGTTYSETLEVMGGYGNYVWTLGGEAANWLSITGQSNGSCDISGTAPTQAGTYTLTVHVEDIDSAYSRPTLTADKTLTITVNAGPLADFTIGAPADSTAGTEFSVTITAKDNYGNTTTDVSGDTTLSTVEGDISPSSLPDSVFTDDGIWNGNVTLTASGSRTISVENYPATAYFSIFINPAPASYLTVTGNGTMTAGDSEELVITAYDEYNNLATGYDGTKSLTFTGPGTAPDGTSVPTVEGIEVGNPVDVNFIAGESDLEAATFIPYLAETTSVDVSDGLIDSYGDPNYDYDVTVDPASVSYVKIRDAAGGAGSEVDTHVMTADDTFTVWSAGYDPYGNYNTDVRAMWSTTGTLDPIIFGTPWQSTIFSPHTAPRSGTIEAEPAPGITGDATGTITVNPGAANYFKITGSSTMTAGSSQTITITAYDQDNNVAINYGILGTDLIFSGANASPNPPTVPTCTDRFGVDVAFGTSTRILFSDGVGTSTMKLYNAETAHIKATQGAIGTSDANDLDVTVSPAAKAKLLWVSNPSTSVYEGATWDPFSIEITDPYGNRTAGSDQITLLPVSLGGTRIKNAAAGLVTFNDITGNIPGTASVQGTATGVTPTSVVNVEVIDVLSSVPNPSFESGVAGPDGWETFNSASFLWDVDFVYDGSKSVGIACGGGCDSITGWRTSKFIAINPDLDYELSAYYWWDGDPEDRDYHGINIRFYDKYGNFLSGTGVTVDAEDPSTEWHQTVRTFSAPSNCFMIKISVERTTEDSPSSATVWFDYVTLRII